jgi:hypothetical protein
MLDPSVVSSPSLLGCPSTAHEMITFVLDKTWLQPCTSTYEEGMWRSILETEAAQHRYLDRSAVSLWTLYQSFQDSSYSSALRITAYRHNLEASNLFRQSNQVITKQNWFAVLTFGVAMVIFQFAATQANDDSTHDYLEIFKLMRGTSKVAQAVVPYFRQSHIKLFMDNQRQLDRPTLEQDVWQGVTRLEEVSFLEGTPAWAIKACRDAILELKEWVRETDARPRSWANFLRWPGIVSDDFVRLLCDGDDSALLIFVYWCLLMHRSPKLWFMSDWAYRDARLAIKAMQDTSTELLDWPRWLLARF